MLQVQILTEGQVAPSGVKMCFYHIQHIIGVTDTGVCQSPASLKMGGGCRQNGTAAKSAMWQMQQLAAMV
jgi:hypothetical protein